MAIGAPATVTDGEIARHKIALPMLDIHTIGAGGGSIAWLDDGGLLRMGPQSAGAAPGPACYGKGGTLPTTTDANLVLGYLDPDYFAGAKMQLDTAAARRAIETNIAAPMGLTVEAAAAGMYRVACNNMAQGVREVTIKRGYDPREFPFIAAGGAGPIHSCLICNELEIPLQIVPRSYVGAMRFRHVALGAEARFRAHVRLAAGRARLAAPRRDAADATRRRACSGGRTYCCIASPIRRPLRLPLFEAVSRGVIRRAFAGDQRRDTATIGRSFHAEHNRLYGYSWRWRQRRSN